MRPFTSYAPAMMCRCDGTSWPGDISWRRSTDWFDDGWYSKATSVNVSDNWPSAAAWACIVTDCASASSVGRPNRIRNITFQSVAFGAGHNLTGQEADAGIARQRIPLI